MQLACITSNYLHNQDSNRRIERIIRLKRNDNPIVNCHNTIHINFQFPKNSILLLFQFQCGMPPYFDSARYVTRDNKTSTQRWVYFRTDLRFPSTVHQAMYRGMLRCQSVGFGYFLRWGRTSWQDKKNENQRASSYVVGSACCNIKIGLND